MDPETGKKGGPLRRAAALVGWGLFLGALGVLWRDPTLLQRLRHGGGEQPGPSDTCELSSGEPCVARFADGTEARLQVSPAGFLPGTPVTWTVTLSDPELQVQGLELTGVSMPMGLTTLAVKQTAPGTWQAQGALPLCTITQMEWRADVLVSGEGRERVAAYQFWTVGQAPTQAQPPGRGAGAADAPPPTWGDFTVQTAQGPLALSDLRGKVVLLYFGYTACPDVCPTTLSTLGAALRQLDPAEQERVVGLMVSLDPARDGVERLHTYTSHFHPAFRGGTTEDAALERITADWGISWRVVPLGESAMSYAVDHATYSILVGPDGAVIQTIEHGTSPDQVAATLRQVLAGAPAAPPPGE